MHCFLVFVLYVWDLGTFIHHKFMRWLLMTTIANGRIVNTSISKVRELGTYFTWDFVQEIRTYETWNNLIGATYCYPFSLFFLEQLEPIFKDYLITKSEYENVFYMWEHLKSLMYGYNKCYLIEFSVPMGNFFRQRIEYKMRHKEPESYTLFFEEADKLKNNWEPIKQGMFGGSYDNYKQTYEQVEVYYQQYRKY